MQDDPTMKRLQAGENRDSLCDAIGDLYVAWRMDLWRLAAFKNFGCKDDLEDLVQDVFFDLYVRVSDGANIENPKGWLYKALLHRATDLHRRKQRTSKYLASLPTPRYDHEQGVEESLERAERLKQALSQLSARERDFLMLRLLGLTYQEIAQILDTNIDLVSAYISRGFRKLRIPKSKGGDHD